VVFDRFDHHTVLVGRRWHLHAPSSSDGRVRNIAVAGDLIGCVDNHNALVQLIGKHSGRFPQESGLAHTGTTEEQHTLAGLNQITHDGDRAEHSATNSAGEADNLPRTIADSGDAVKRSLDASPIVPAKYSNAFGDEGEIFTIHFSIGQSHFAALKPGLRYPPEIHDDLD
jgi:hypothetical protein